MTSRRDFIKQLTAGGTAVMLSPIWVSTCKKHAKYKATWESLKKHSVPEWFEDAKFGIFIHWGIYSVPAYKSEWYPHYMYTKDSDIYSYHKHTYGPPWEFGYKDFIPDFTAEKWDPERWAKLFKEAGAKYVVPVAEHHDGFAMWDSDLTQWDAADRGPHRDIIGDLEKAVRNEGMKYAPSYHRAHNWQYYKNSYKLPQKTDTENSKYSGMDGIYPEPHESGAPPSKAFLDNWQARWEEIQNKYRPDLAWFDYGWGEAPAYYPYMKKIMANYYNKAQEWGKEVAFNNKTIHSTPNGGPPRYVGDFVGWDNNIMDSIHERKWQCPTYMDPSSWAYNKLTQSKEYESAKKVVRKFIDIVSKNGNLLLDVGPKADGTVPNYVWDRLRKIGQWVEINGEAIFATRPWKVYGEGPSTEGKVNEDAKEEVKYTPQDIRFTQSKNGKILFAIVMNWPNTRKITIENLKNTPVKAVTLLGHGKVNFNRQQKGLSIQFPKEQPCNYAYSLKIEV